METELILEYHNVPWEKINYKNKTNSLLIYYIILEILK